MYILEFKDFIDKGTKYNKDSRKDDKINLRKLQKKLYKTVKDKKESEMKVYLINGTYIRDKVCVDYTMGGHSYVYSFIPEDEIWLDNSMNKKDIDIVLQHELTEHNHMKYNNMSYGSAHTKASYEEIENREM